jgi:hypothetical protein
MLGLIYILIAILAALFWVDSLHAREAATKTAKLKCNTHQLQFLDQTVALTSIGIRWTQQGIRLRRAYRFDYSLEGVGREQGEITMIGSRFESIDIAQLERVKDITPL